MKLKLNHQKLISKKLLLSKNSTNRLNVNVTIADTICDVDTITTTEIKCYTNSYSKSSTKALVKLFVIGNGFGINVIIFLN